MKSIEPRILSSVVLTSAGSRSFNEDHALLQTEKRFFAVADGFGGPVAGAEASKRSCESIKRFLQREAGDLDATLPFVLRDYFSLAGNVLFNACLFANREVLGLNRGKTVHEKGGCSLIAGFMDGDLLALASVGLCSATLIRGGRSVRLCTPRSYALLKDPFGSRGLDSGLQVPLTAVGLSDHFEPEIVEAQIQVGDWLVVQTDGVDSSWIHRIEEAQTLGDVDRLKIELEGSQFSENAALVLVGF